MAALLSELSGEEQPISYPYRNGSDFLPHTPVKQGARITLNPWDLAIISEQ
jgi:hypothetical protein